MNSEKKMEELANRLSKLPTLPGVAMKILEAVKNDELSLQELGEIISTDPALSSEVLKLINSSFFSLSQQIKSVNHAVNLLGLNSVKNLALSFSLVKDFQKQKTLRFDYKYFWKSSLLGALSARIMSQKIFPAFSEDAFFLGLLQNIGILALSQSIPDQYDLITREMERSSCNWHEAEKKILGFDHAMFGRHLVKSWGLPRDFYTPIRYHHAPEELDSDSKEIVTITRILHLTSLFVEFLFLPGRTLRLGLLDSYAKKYDFVDKFDIDEMAGTVQQQAEEVLPLFEIQIVKEENYLHMIEEARKELINLSSNFLTDLLTQRKQIEELNQKVVHDSMTGLKNYHFFMEALEKEINRSLRYNLPLSLIISDIDHFKKVNDTHGHLAGDQVLKSVAECLKKGLRDSDSVARYGGEEFAAILPETDLSGALVVAERMRKEVQQLQTEFKGRKIPVTMSFGTACFSYEEDVTKSNFIQRADQALLKAKQKGRNRCCSF